MVRSRRSNLRQPRQAGREGRHRNGRAKFPRTIRLDLAEFWLCGLDCVCAFVFSESVCNPARILLVMVHIEVLWISARAARQFSALAMRSIHQAFIEPGRCGFWGWHPFEWKQQVVQANRTTQLTPLGADGSFPSSRTRTSRRFCLQSILGLSFVTTRFNGNLWQRTPPKE